MRTHRRSRLPTGIALTARPIKAARLAHPVIDQQHAICAHGIEIAVRCCGGKLEPPGITQRRQRPYLALAEEVTAQVPPCTAHLGIRVVAVPLPAISNGETGWRRATAPVPVHRSNRTHALGERRSRDSPLTSRCIRCPRQRGQNLLSSSRLGSFRRFFSLL